MTYSLLTMFNRNVCLHVTNQTKFSLGLLYKKTLTTQVLSAGIAGRDAISARKMTKIIPYTVQDAIVMI